MVAGKARAAWETVKRIPVGLVVAAFVLNVLTSLLFLMDTSSGTSSAWWSFPIDDSWIHLNYVRGIVTEGCFCYNSGISEAGTTSWGWVLLLSPFYLVGHLWMGFDPALLTKLVGIGLGAVTTVLVYYLVFRITASRLAGALIGAAITLEPTSVFLRLSGMEGTLVTVVVLASAATLMNRRWAATGLLLGLAFWSRPEAGIYVGGALGLGFLYWFANWPGRRGFRQTLGSVASPNLIGSFAGLTMNRRALGSSLRGVTPMIYFMGIPALMLLAWIAFNLSVNGHIFPNTYLAKNDSTLGLFPVNNMVILWNRGVGDFQAWTDSWRLFLMIPFAAVGSWAVFRKFRILGIALILFPPLLILGVGSGIRFGDAEFNFFARRYIDPMIPVLLMLMLLGTWVTVAMVRNYVVNARLEWRRKIYLLGFFYAVISLYFFSAATGQLNIHRDLLFDYSWNTRNIFDEDELAGLWLKRHAGPDESVLIADAGAIRYFSDLLTLDGVGLNTHENIGLPTMQIALQSQPDYVAIWEDSVWDALPNSTKVARFDTPRNTILGGGAVAIYRLDWERDFRVEDRPLADHAGQLVIDSLDLADKESELSHNQTITFVSFAPAALGSIGGIDIRERGISHDGAVAESFEMATVPGRSLDLVVRYRSDALPGLEEPFATVAANGVEIGELPLGGLAGLMSETSILIPGAVINGPLTRFDIDWRGFVTEFRWWTLDAGDGDGDFVFEVPDSSIPPEDAVAFDSFSAPDGVPADFRVPDTIQNGGWWLKIGGAADFEIEGGRLVEKSLNGGADHRMVMDAGLPDVAVEADIEWSGGAVGLVIRHDGGPDDNWVMAWYDGDAKQLLLAKLVDGAFSVVAQVNREWGAEGRNRRMRLEGAGTEIQVWLDGAVVITATVEELTENRFAGVFARSETVTSWDNFALLPIPERPEPQETIQ
ncbi:MAG: hypothetical protein IH868_05425 [Chloroflexi bacterium]|nr:hypothetical protein [Chloroflexota bacterium]